MVLQPWELLHRVAQIFGVSLVCAMPKCLHVGFFSGFVSPSEQREGLQGSGRGSGGNIQWA